MGRPVFLSNGQLLVGLDESGLVHDFYYPYVGLENLTNARSLQHKIGVWVDGAFSWVDDDTWQINVDFESDALVSRVSLSNTELAIDLKLVDFVDTEYDALVRRVTLENKADHERDIRLFMHQVFQISRAGRADTALYVPDDNYILDYKGRYCLLIAGKFVDGGDFDQFAVGNYGIEGKSGTFRDAEDGELSGNLVEHGGVDSVLRFARRVPAGGSFGVDYWIAVADSQADAQLIHTHLKYYPVEKRLDNVRAFWRDWMAPAAGELAKIPDKYRAEAQKSLLVIKAHCDSRGSVLASGDSTIFNYGRDYYCYCWPRDAAYAIWPLIRLGIFTEAKLFFEFARDTRHKDGYLMHKYQPDRAIGSTWHPLVHGRRKELAIQEDETAIVVYMLGEYWRASHDLAFIESFYATFIEPCANFMIGFVDDATGLPHASYDLWEEKFLTSTYTVATVIAALNSAAEMAEALDHASDAVRWRRAAERISSNLDHLYSPDGYWRKGYLLQEDGSLNYDDTLDTSSLYGMYMFARLPMDDPRMNNSYQRIASQLYNSSPSGGVLRYEHDAYFLKKTNYLGNPWIVCSLWLAQYFLAGGAVPEAQGLLDWTLSRALTSGALSEQFDPENGAPLGVTPLVWSHAEFINTALDLGKTTLA